MSAHSSDATLSRVEPLPIGIVCNVRLYREGLAESLGRREGLTVVWAANDIEGAVARAAQLTAAAVVLDVATPDCLQGVRVMRQVSPSLAIVAFALQDVDREIIACAEAGMGGFVTCDGSIDDLATAIIRAAHGEMSCSPRAAAVLTQRVASLAATGARGPNASGALTDREQAILELLDKGLSNKEIAARLHIQLATVKNHVHNVLEKLRVPSRAEAAAKHRAAGPSRSLRSRFSLEAESESTRSSSRI